MTLAIGADDSDNTTWPFLLINLAFALLFANGLRKGYRWAWWCAVVLACVPVLGAVIIVVIFIVTIWVPIDDFTTEGVAQFAADSFIWLAYLVLLIRGRRSFRAAASASSNRSAARSWQKNNSSSLPRK